MFPAVDPIPLPAPVWLFKLLHIVTLALHFAAMELMVGGLLVAAVWAIVGRGGNNPTLKTASGALITRLPVVMTYVINLGVPPLLFAQVLYGRAIYSSSVLMGVYWISVIFILIFAYWFLYVCGKWAQEGKAWGWLALISAVMILKIGAIYSSNMTLMIRPDVWQDMYREDPTGLQMNSGDPTMLPRYLYFMVSGLATAGVGMLLLGLNRNLGDGASEALGAWGGRLTAVAGIAALGLGYWAWSVQPEAVRTGIAGNQLWMIGGYAWLATGALLVALGGFAGVSPAGRGWMPAAATGLVAFLNIATMTLVRDGVRDVTLLQHGYDVWDRTIVTNWSVVGLFLFLFVVGLGIVGWLTSIAAGARQEKEIYV